MCCVSPEWTFDERRSRSETREELRGNYNFTVAARNSPGPVYTRWPIKTKSKKPSDRACNRAVPACLLSRAVCFTVVIYNLYALIDFHRLLPRSESLGPRPREGRRALRPEFATARACGNDDIKLDQGNDKPGAVLGNASEISATLDPLGIVNATAERTPGGRVRKYTRDAKREKRMVSAF